MPKYRDLPCSICGELLWRSKSSLPEGQATCQPCRRARRLAGTRSHCIECGHPLTHQQRLAGTVHCCRRCAFTSGAAEIPAQRDYKRKRLSCTLRPFYVPGTEDEPLRGMPEPPPLDSGLWLQGPGREYFLIVRHYDDGRIRSRCIQCWDEKPYSGERHVWCSDCAMLFELRAA